MSNKNKSRSSFNFRGFLYIITPVFAILIYMAAFAQQARWAAPKEAGNVKNPFAGKGSVTAAKTLYVSNCGPCHGEKGKGNGPAAPGLNPKPADHTSTAVQSETDGSLFWKITNGRNPMPSYKKVFNDQQRWELINFIRTLAKH